MLTINSETYSRDCIHSNYYYESIELKVIANGYYAFIGESDVHMYGDLYEHSFNRINPFENLLSQNYRRCGYSDFMLTAYLDVNSKYILVVTTYKPDIVANFSVTAFGSENVTMERMSEYICIYIYREILMTIYVYC